LSYASRLTNQNRKLLLHLTKERLKSLENKSL